MRKQTIIAAVMALALVGNAGLPAQAACGSSGNCPVVVVSGGNQCAGNNNCQSVIGNYLKNSSQGVKSGTDCQGNNCQSAKSSLGSNSQSVKSGTDCQGSSCQTAKSGCQTSGCQKSGNDYQSILENYLKNSNCQSVKSASDKTNSSTQAVKSSENKSNCQTAGSNCQNSKSNCQTAGNNCQNSKSNCQTAGNNCQSSKSNCQTAGSNCQNSKSNCQTAGSNCQNSKSNCQTAGSNCQTAGNNCQNSKSNCQTAGNNCQENSSQASGKSCTGVNGQLTKSGKSSQTTEANDNQATTAEATCQGSDCEIEVTEQEATTEQVVTPEETTTESLTYAEQILSLVNAERAKAGLHELTLDTNISSAAQIRANEIVTSFSHTRPDGRKFSTVLTDNGIRYTGAGENIAWGQPSPEKVMNAWMNSEGHRANIMNASFTKLGVGHLTDSNGRNYWVQLFTY